ncbi:HD domain-containing protein [Streptomyces chrestomyceticus]
MRPGGCGITCWRSGCDSSWPRTWRRGRARVRWLAAAHDLGKATPPFAGLDGQRRAELVAAGLPVDVVGSTKVLEKDTKTVSGELC